MSELAHIDYRTFASYKPLFLDYLHDFDRLADFFPADPFDSTKWQVVAKAVSQRDRARKEVAAALDPLNRALGADSSAMASVEALSAGALAVVTGQQVGLFGGPLYTLYKALTAVKFARAATERLSTPVVPLFWMDADDHDFDEIRRSFVLDSSGELLELAHSNDDEESRIPVGNRTVGKGIEELLASLGSALPDTEFKAEVMQKLRECYEPGRTFSQAFGSLLLALTRGSGLAVVDPTLPELKAIGKSVFEHEVENASRSSALVEEATKRLVSLGYHAQATPASGQLNIFYSNPDRYAVSLDGSNRGSKFGLEGIPSTLDKRELLSKIAEEPERFSPNVLLRPLYQDTLLPTLAYVAGPSELAYFAQIGDVYRDFDIPMPIIASRASFTIVERPQARFLDRYDVELERLGTNDESLLNEIVRAQTPPQLDEDLERARSCIQNITDALERDLQKVDNTLVSTVKSTRGKLLHHLGELEQKVLRAVKRKNETVSKQFFSARTALFPGFTMQERKLSAAGYLVKYGWHFAKLVEESTEPASKSHGLLYP